MAPRPRPLFVLVLTFAGCGGSADLILLEAPALDGGVLVPSDGGARDAGPHDVGRSDAGSRDAGVCYDWASVQPTFAEACAQLCHTDPPRFSAPMPLVTYTDFHRIAGNARVYELVALRIRSLSGRMPPPSHRRQLAPHEIHRIVLWTAMGAPVDCLD